MIKAGKPVFIENICPWSSFQFGTVLTETSWFLSLAVHRYHIHCTLGGYCDEIGCEYLVCRIRYLFGENVSLEEIIRVVNRFELYVAGWKMLLCFNICVNLVVETAFQFGALSGQFLRIHREILVAGGSC